MIFHHFHKIFMVLILLIPSGILIRAQIPGKIEISIFRGNIRSSGDIITDFNYGSFSRKITSYGKTNGLEITYQLKDPGLRIGYHLQYSSFSSFGERIDNPDIILAEDKIQKTFFISNGLVLKYSLFPKSVFQPFISFCPSVKYYNYEMDPLIYSFGVPASSWGTGERPVNIKIDQPAYTAGFWTVGFLSEIGFGLFMENNYGIQMKAGYDMGHQKLTKLAPDKLSNFSVQFGLLYRFLNNKIIYVK